MHDDSSTLAEAANDPLQNASLEMPLTAAELAERRKRNRESFNKRRGELLDDLIRNLDIVVYAELSAVYYMDCSFLRFLFRAVIQLMFLSPKPAPFPDPPPHRPYVGGIFGGNILCMILHLILSAPSAGEATRGYLHGGLAMDFIGQKGPTPKLQLLLLDLLILALQVVQLSVQNLRIKLKEHGRQGQELGSVSVTTSSGEMYTAGPASVGQSLDDEERGVRRSAEEQNLGDTIEMEQLTTSGTAIESSAQEGTNASDQTSLLASTTLPTRSDAHIFDAFNSGQIVVADLDPWKTVTDQFVAWQKAPRDSATDAANIEAGRLLRERLARRMLRWRG